LFVNGGKISQDFKGVDAQGEGDCNRLGGPTPGQRKDLCDSEARWKGKVGLDVKFQRTRHEIPREHYHNRSGRKRTPQGGRQMRSERKGGGASPPLSQGILSVGVESHKAGLGRGKCANAGKRVLTAFPKVKVE